MMKKGLKSLCAVTSILLGMTLMSGCAKSGATGGQAAGKSSGGGDIVIGAVLPLTGDISTFGQSSKEALELLQEEVNKAGGVLGKKIKFQFGDDQNQPSVSPTVGQKLIDEGAVALIGSVASKCSIALGPVATQNKVPMLTSMSTNPKVTTDGGEYVFRACFIDPFQGTVLAKFATADLKAKKAAILYDVSNDYSKGLAEFFEKGFKANGGDIVATATYNNGDTDFKAQLTKIKGTNPEVLLLPDYYNTVGVITKQAKELGLNATFLGGDGWDSADLTKVAGDSINGGYFSNHYSPEDNSPEVTGFLKAYGEKYKGKDGKALVPDALAALAYDAGKIMVEAIKKAGSTDGDKVKDALKGINIKVLTGTITFDKDRNPVKDAVMIKVDGGKMSFVKKVSP
jgi:branched-chain amino acid transport system substrate-binding protein